MDPIFELKIFFSPNLFNQELCKKLTLIGNYLKIRLNAAIVHENYCVKNLKELFIARKTL